MAGRVQVIRDFRDVHFLGLDLIVVVVLTSLFAAWL